MSREKIGADSDSGTSHHSSDRLSPLRRVSAGVARFFQISCRPASSQPPSSTMMPIQISVSNSAKPWP